MPFDANESAILAEYARRNAGKLSPDESAIVNEYLARSSAASSMPAAPAAPTPGPISPQLRTTMSPRRPGDVIDQQAARRANPSKRANPPRLPSTPIGDMLWEGAKGIGQGIVGMIPGVTGKPDPNDPTDPLHGDFNAERSGVTDDPFTWIGSQVHGFLKRDREMQQRPPAPTLPGKLVNAASVALPQVEAIAAPSRAVSAGRAPTYAENVNAARGGGQLVGAMTPAIAGAVSARRTAAANAASAPGAPPKTPKAPGMLDFIRVHGKDRLAQSWFGRTAANAAEGRRITQWVADRALTSLDAAPKSVGADGAASVTGWGGDALHTQLLRERELAGGNVDHAVALADTDGFRASVVDAVKAAYDAEIARLTKEQGGRAAGTIRGLQKELEAKLSQAAVPMSRREIVQMYRDLNQQLTDSIRENPTKATDPFMRAEGNLRNALSEHVKSSSPPEVAKAFDEYHLANKAYESFGPMYDSMRTGALKDPFTGVQTSIIQRVAGGPRVRMKTIGVLDAHTPEATRAALRGSKQSAALPAVPMRPASTATASAAPTAVAAPVAPRLRINLLRSSAGQQRAVPGRPLTRPKTATATTPSESLAETPIERPASNVAAGGGETPPKPPPVVRSTAAELERRNGPGAVAPSAPAAPAFPRTATAIDTLRTAIEQARRLGDHRSARSLTQELQRRLDAADAAAAPPPPRQGGAALLRPGAENTVDYVPLPWRKPGRIAVPGGGETVGAELSDVIPQIEARYAHEHARQVAESVPTEHTDALPELLSPRATSQAARSPYPLRQPQSLMQLPKAPNAPKPTAFDLVNGTQGETASGAYARMFDNQRAARPPRMVRTEPLEETFRPRRPEPKPQTATVAAATTEPSKPAPKRPAAPARPVAPKPPAAVDEVADLRRQAKEAARRGQQMTAQRLTSRADRLVRERARSSTAASAAEALGVREKAPIAPKPAAPETTKPRIVGPSSREVSDWSKVDAKTHPWRAEHGDTIAEGDVRGTVRGRFITPRRGPAYSIDLKDGRTAMVFEDRITEHTKQKKDDQPPKPKLYSRAAPGSLNVLKLRPDQGSSKWEDALPVQFKRARKAPPGTAPGGIWRLIFENDLSRSQRAEAGDLIKRHNAGGGKPAYPSIHEYADNPVPAMAPLLEQYMDPQEALQLKAKAPEFYDYFKRLFNGKEFGRTPATFRASHRPDAEWPADPNADNENEALFQTIPPWRQLPYKFKNARTVNVASPISGKIHDDPEAYAEYGVDFPSGRTDTIRVGGDYPNNMLIARKGSDTPDVWTHEVSHAIYAKDLTQAQRDEWDQHHNAVLAQMGQELRAAGVTSPKDPNFRAALARIKPKYLRAIVNYADAPYESFAEASGQYQANPSAFLKEHPVEYALMKKFYGGEEYRGGFMRNLPLKPRPVPLPEASSTTNASGGITRRH